jgi:hypothetical protein
VQDESSKPAVSQNCGVQDSQAEFLPLTDFPRATSSQIDLIATRKQNIEMCLPFAKPKKANNRHHDLTDLERNKHAQEFKDWVDESFFHYLE